MSGTLIANIVLRSIQRSRNGGQVRRTRLLLGSVTLTLCIAGTASGSAFRWAGEQITAPTGAISSSLYAVSCPSRIACTAVGYFDVPVGRRFPLVERNDGSGWQPQGVPTPTTVRDVSLDGVSCPSKRACIAVGDGETKADVSVAVAEHWDGRKWSIQRAVIPPRARGTSLSDVSCPSDDACTAAGTFWDGTACVKALVEHWNGHRWSLQSTPHPWGCEWKDPVTGESHPLPVEHGAVSCPSKRVCTLVLTLGRDPSIGHYETVVEQWNGSSWSVQRMWRTSGSPSASVSCTSRRFCAVAAGHDLARLNGTKWSVKRLFVRVSGLGLHGVSCASPAACTVVGEDNAGGRVAFWAGQKFAMQQLPPPAPGADLTSLWGVSCASTSVCTAVGETFTPRSDGWPVGLVESTTGLAGPPAVTG